MVNKRLAVGVGCMLVGAILVIAGLLKVPVIAACLIVIGGAVGFVGYMIYERRNGNIPNDLNLG